MELSEFEKKYKLLLNKLDMNENRLDALKTPEKKEAESEEASRRLYAKNPEKLDGGQGEGRFPSRLKTTLEPQHSPDQLDRLPVRVYARSATTYPTSAQSNPSAQGTLECLESRIETQR